VLTGTGMWKESDLYSGDGFEKEREECRNVVEVHE
jgi:hypothetical protein